MATQEDPILQRLRDVAVALHRTTAERDALVSRANEPIAIVGIGCRFPGGADGPDAYWRLLDEGRDAVGPLEPRWQLVGSRPAADAPGWGGLVADVDRFDAAFFGISPREARALDPQQRLLLEVAWEALEDAGIAPPSLAGTDAGVFLGASWTDYGQSVLRAPDEARDAYAGTGNMLSVAAGRISYTFGLQGPCATVDTACSSSLVSVHLACQSLRLGECAVALAGGVSLMLSADTMTTMARLQALSPDGRCRSFDASANGFVRGEGCGLVILKRLSDALRDGDRIWATVRGSAINQDGRSNGLTAPNGPAQEALIRTALRAARVAPEAIGYVEAHGTGTPLGDPIELEALRSVIGGPRPDGSGCVLGAVKTNIGHLESAAGIAGLIKAALVLGHDRIPKNLNFRALNPRIRQAGSVLSVASEPVPWPRGATPRHAGVSSFGISGTNAHAVLEEAPVASERAPAPARSAELVVLSAKSPEALRAGAARLSDWLGDHPDATLGDVALSALTTRATLEHRLGVAAADRAGLREALDAAASGEASSPAVAPSEGRPKVAFVFPGQGSQWVGMGRQLLKEEPGFRAAIEECDRAIASEAGWSVIEELEAPAERSRLERIEVVQPLLFAIEVALARCWQSWGVEPDAVIGHSMGEVAAACVAGVLSVADAARVICRRGALLTRIAGKGEMALVELSMQDATEALAGHEDRVAVAVNSGPASTVLSGDAQALGEVLATLEARGVFCRRVKVDFASHSPQVDPILAELAARLEPIAPAAAGVPMFSTVTGAWVEGRDLGARYWADNLRRPVRFAQGVQALLDDGFRLFLEISPHPVLTQAVDSVVAGAGAPGQALGSLRRDQPERLTLLSALGLLHARGCPLDARKLFPAGGRRLTLPTYAWQRERYWVAAPAVAEAAGEATRHPLLGMRLPLAGGDVVYESRLSVRHSPWLADHCAAGRPVVSVAALAEIVRAAGEEASGRGSVGELVLRAPVLLGESETRRLQVVVSDDGRRAAVYSRAEDAPAAQGWTQHATAQLDPAPLPGRPLDVPALRALHGETRDVGGIYAQLTAAGLSYGPSLRTLRLLERGRTGALGLVALESDDAGGEYGLHPALLDGALQAAVGAVDGLGEQPLMPFTVGRIVVHRPGASRALVRVVVRSADAEGIRVDLALADAAGALLAEVGDLRLRHVDLATLAHSAEGTLDAFFRLDWSEAPSLAAVAGAAVGRVAVVPVGDEAAAAELARGLSAAGTPCATIPLAALRDAAGLDHVVCVWPEADSGQAAADLVATAVEVVKAAVSLAPAPRLWWVTRRALAVREGDAVAPGAGAVWGLGRALTHEHPELGCTLLDAAGRGSLADAVRLELGASGGENQVAWRDGKRRVARLVRVAPSHAPAAVAPWRTDGTTLVTGGLGALGLEMARDLARRGVKHLLLVGRRGLETPGAPGAVKDLEGLGARVTVAAADVADRTSLARVLAAVPADAPLRAVVHAAGLAANGRILLQTRETLAVAMDPKAIGAWNLHELTRAGELDAFVVFSSVTGALGNAGQGPYTAANGYLDALVAHRRALGLPAQSLAWGPWEGPGMLSELDAVQQARVVAQGYRIIRQGEGRALLAAALVRPEAALVVAPFDLRVVAKAQAGSLAPVWRSLVQIAPAPSALPAGEWARSLAALPGEARVEAATQAVRVEVARVLSLGRASAVPPDRPLRELGLDSLMAVELRNALARRAGVALPATVALDHPTPAALGRLLAQTLPAAPAAPDVRALAVAQTETETRRSSAIESGDFPVSQAIPEPGPDRIDSIPMGERWLADAFRVIPTPGGFAQRTVDISGVMRALDVANAAGVRATLPHAMIRAAALALARNPDLHQTVCGYRKLTPGTVDIGLSMAGQTTYAPVVVLPSVERQSLGVLVGAVEEAIVVAREKEARDLAAMRKLGWMTPFGFFRRFVVKTAQEMFWYRRKIVGTFQVTCVPTVDSAVPLQFYSGSILAFGRPRDAVVAVDGRPEIRQTLTLTICADHVAMDGLRAAALLNEIVAVLESDELMEEARDAGDAARLHAPSGIRALGPAQAAAAAQARSA